MVKVCMVALIGLPGQGKTTLCKKLVQENLNCSIVHVCYDNFLNFDFEIHQSFKLQRSGILESVRKLITTYDGGNIYIDELGSFKKSSRIVEGSDRLLILIDDNNFYRSMRYDYYKLAKETKANFSVIFFSLPLHIAMERNSQRLNKIPTDIITKMNNCLEPPSMMHKWEAKIFVIKDERFDYHGLLQFLVECFEFSVEKSKSSTVVEQSELHKLDLLLRKRVGEAIKDLSNSGRNISSVAAVLNSKRKQVLEDVKKGIIILESGGNYDHLINLI